MDVSRRWFIGGAASFGALAGCRVFNAAPGSAFGRARLRFGVVSDVHVSHKAEPGPDVFAANGDCATFEKTLKWFDAQGVDAVMIAGDMADHGGVSELQAIGATWDRVFPGDRSTLDGRRVEKVFVYGNHDWEGQTYGGWADRRYGKENAAPHYLRTDYAGNWKRIFHEDYAPIYMKTIKGYSFIGQHWDDQGWGDKCRFDRIIPFMAEHGRSLDPEQPFFYVQHPHPLNTCYGAWAWGHDAGAVTGTLCDYPNAVAFSGHSHYPLTDERSIWQGTFTSLGTASLRYSGHPYDARHDYGSYENSSAAIDGQFWNPYKVMAGATWNYGADDCVSDTRQGMLVTVYDDCITYARRDFYSDLSLGPDWVMPLPAAEKKPFSIEKRRAKHEAPVFPAGAKIAVKKTEAKRRGGNGVKAEKVPAWEFTFPQALAGRTRPHEYQLWMMGGGKTLTRRVLATGFNHSPDDPRARKDMVVRIACDRLEGKELEEVHVFPFSSLEVMGEPLKQKA